MKINKTGLTDELHITVRDKYGNVKKDYTLTYGILDKILCRLGLKHHSIVYKGMAQTAKLLVDDTNTDFGYMDIGTGTNAANNAQTALQTTVLATNRAAVTGTVVKTDTNSTDNETAQWVHTFSHANDADLTGTQTITEVGIFTADVGSDIMLLRIKWAGDSCDWNAGDTLQLTIKCQVKQGS